LQLSAAVPFNRVCTPFFSSKGRTTARICTLTKLH
jgi:hypothetical protein